MTTFIALLKGINVGGKNIIKMSDLKKAFESLGYTDVQTYIQSGNIIFKSNDNEDTLNSAITQMIEEAFGLSIAVILRDAKEMEQIINNCPFTDEEIKEAESLAKVECLYVAFLPMKPLQKKVEQLNAYCTESDRFAVVGRDVYLLFHHSIRDSKLANNLKKLDLPSTVRNWNTVNKLAEMTNEM
jgi:uncharacterized protein (DUF1697 family)